MLKVDISHISYAILLNIPFRSHKLFESQLAVSIGPLQRLTLQPLHLVGDGADMKAI
jgi:hypothetical protein